MRKSLLRRRRPRPCRDCRRLRRARRRRRRSDLRNRRPCRPQPACLRAGRSGLAPARTARRRPPSRRRSRAARVRSISNRLEQVVGIAALLEAVEHGGRGECVIHDRAPAERRDDEGDRLMPGAHARASRADACVIQRILAAIWVASSTSPVRRRISSASMPATSACARRSIQMTHGASAWPSASTGTQPSSCPATAMPLMSAGARPLGGERARNRRLQRPQPQARILLGPARSGKVG